MSESVAERVLNWLQWQSEKDSEEFFTLDQIKQHINRTRGVKQAVNTLTKNGHLEHTVAENRNVWRWIGLNYE